MSSPAQTPGRWAAAARALLRAGVAVGLLFLILEATTRLALFGIRGLDPRRLGFGGGGGVRERLTFHTDPAIVFEYKANLDEVLLLNRLRTNSWGMRDREYPLEKPPDTFRVAVIGSSFTFPAGVEIEDAYHSVLEARLSAEFAPARYEFLNFAVGLHLPSQFVAMIQQRALRFDPDLIVVSASPPAVAYFHRDWDRRANPAVLDALPKGVRSTFIAVAKSRLGIGPTKNSRPQGLLSRPAGLSVVEKLGEISRGTGIPIVVARLELEARPPEPVERRLSRATRANGMHYIDTRHAFAGRNPRDQWIYELDPHPNAEAHTIFADVIEDFLRNEGLLGSRARPGRAASRSMD